MPFPYSQISAIACGRVDYCLSKIVMKLYVNMLETDSKSCIYGCIQALSDLACTYPCTVYRMGWDITNRVRETDGNIKDLLSLCVSLLNSSVHIYDITFLVNLINLTLNLYAGNTVFRPDGSMLRTGVMFAKIGLALGRSRVVEKQILLLHVRVSSAAAACSARF
ncbi:hypothetical protein D910_12626 [Dendroctonus ponderosae]